MDVGGKEVGDEGNTEEEEFSSNEGKNGAYAE